MIIEIRPDIFDDVEYMESLKMLLTICLYNHRHDFYVELSEVMNKPIFKQLDKDSRDSLEEIYNRIIIEPLIDTQQVSESDADCFGLVEAIRFLNQPFLIILENSYNDGYFVDALLNNFEEGAEIARHKENGWLKYSMGGGSTIPQAVSAEMSTYETLPKDNHIYLRCFVLIDSDREYPSATPKEGQVKLVEFLEQFGIPYHILEKRQMENYLPIEAYDDISDNTNYIEAYKRLSSTHKDYFDIKTGFKKEFSQLPTEIQAFYHGIPNNDKTIFETRSMDLGGSFKAEFPKLFQSNKVTQDSLLQRCARQNDPNELPNILTKITELL